MGFVSPAIQKYCAVLLAGLSVLFILPVTADSSTQIFNIRHWAAPDHTRIVIDTSDEAKYTVEKEDQKIVVHFKNAVLSKELPTKIVLNKPGIEQIILRPLPKDAVRVDLLLPERMDSQVFRLKKFQDKPDRVVIDIRFPGVEKQERLSRQQIRVQGKDRIVVIDPGHGGDDPGAIGLRGTREKHVVLAISRKLKDIMDKQGGYRAFLTRKGDYYVPFKKRLEIAKEYGADLFVSIHADAVKGKTAKGSSVYSLSLGGASSEAARILATHENLADIVGGVSEEDSSEASGAIILNMHQTTTINQSRAFGSLVLKHLNDVCQPKYPNVQEAAFRVLKLPDIPSLLIETAFISNPEEEKLLRNSRFQGNLAEAIAASIEEFMVVKTPAQMTITKKGEGSSPGSDITCYHKVKKGETLGIIARKYDTTIAALLKMNHMKLKDPLFVGRKLTVAEPETARAAEKKGKSSDSASDRPAVAYELYRVKKGDTLLNIARRHHAKLGDLLVINHIKINDPLYVNQELKIPKSSSL